MINNIDRKKNKLIGEIASINSEKELDQIVKYIKLTRLNGLHGGMFNGTRKSITIEDLKKEQNFKGINREEFDQLVREIDIQEPIEELLAML